MRRWDQCAVYVLYHRQYHVQEIMLDSYMFYVPPRKGKTYIRHKLQKQIEPKIGRGRPPKKTVVITRSMTNPALCQSSIPRCLSFLFPFLCTL